MYPVIRAANRKEVMVQKTKILGHGAQIEYFTFPKLSETDCITHMFSTRKGGVSKEEFATMNFSYIRGDDPESVTENYKRVAELFGVGLENIVTTDQTHSTNIRVVTIEDGGKGILTPRDYSQIDGLITNERQLVLSCFTADCVPLYFVDPINKVIGVAHSGWRGTVNRMGAEMVAKMQEVFGSKPENLIAAIGPSICQECYEISEEVASQFRKGLWSEEQISQFTKEAYENKYHPDGILLKNGSSTDKYFLDLWLANLIVLRSAGILLEHIDVTDICTKCNASYLFSHRATGGKRGNLGAFIMLN